MIMIPEKYSIDHWKPDSSHSRGKFQIRILPIDFKLKNFSDFYVPKGVPARSKAARRPFQPPVR
jgi:hypothetical protein